MRSAYRFVNTSCVPSHCKSVFDEMRRDRGESSSEKGNEFGVN